MKTPKHSAPPRPLTALALAAAASLALPALAQQAAAPAADKADKPVEQVTVTGSRIRGIAPIGAPVVGVGRNDIETSNVASTTLMLQQVPQVFNLGVSENSRGQSGGSGNITYGSSINLRGIGPFATLVLVNGHRVVSQGTGATSVDPSIIPMLMLERVEIVADGASAIYGSDAVAGVANLILRRNEKTTQGYARFGRGDSYSEHQLGALWATRWQGGQATLGVEHSFRSALSGQDRDWFAGDLRSQGGGDFRGTQCAPGNIIISGTNYAIPAGGVTPANAASLVAGTTNKCDNLKFQDLIPRQERNGLGFTFNHDITPELSLYADGFATERRYRFRPGALSSNLTVPSTNPFYVRPPGAPAGTNETVAYSWVNDLPLNTANGFSRSYEATVGAEYALPAQWRVGGLFTWGYNDDLAVTLGGLNNAAITAALADTNAATALNVFGSGPNNPATLAKLANSVSYAPGTTNFQNVLVKADGPLFSLPGGPVRVAFGAEFQQIKTVGGQTTGAPPNVVTGTVKLERRVQSGYLELAVPVVGPDNALTGMRRLDLTAAVRHDIYSDVGNTTNPKFGLTWEPAAGLQFRGSYGESFRAPGLTQLRGFTNGGRGGLFVQNYSDPTIGGALRVGVALSAANPDLKPETAKTKSFGIEWEPAKGSKLSINFFDITYDNQITGYLSDLALLNREAAFAGTSVIQRNPSAALQAQLLAQYPISGVPPANWTLFVDGRNFNLGRSISKGYDFQASTKINTERWGQFGLNASGTVFTKYELALTPASPLSDQLNNIFNPLRFKARVMGSWSYGATYTSLALNHTNSYTNNLSTPVQTVRANNTLDLRIALALEDFGSSGLLKDATLSLGATNLTDKKPPFVNLAQSNNGGGAYDPTTASPLGRVISVSLDKRF